MTKLRVGDYVECCLRDNSIVSPYQTFDSIEDFNIISKDFKGYYIYIPHYMVIKTSFTITESSCKRLGINKKFLNEQSIYVRESDIYKIGRQLDGLFCEQCQEFVGHAEPNQLDQSFICWNCRNYKNYK